MLLLWVSFDSTLSNALQEPLALLPEAEHSIVDLARAIASQFSDREVIFDTTKADGQHRKCMGNEKLKSLLSRFEFTELQEGIRLTV